MYSLPPTCTLLSFPLFFIFPTLFFIFPVASAAGGDDWSGGAAPPHLPPDIPGAHQRRRQVLDGCPRAGPQVGFCSIAGSL
jgi:hypothetical protein